LPYLPEVFNRIKKSGIDLKIKIDRKTHNNSGYINQAIKYEICKATATNVTIPRTIVFLSL
jgi:hypothetical protein